jgi:hypothetical protein
MSVQGPGSSCPSRRTIWPGGRLRLAWWSRPVVGAVLVWVVPPGGAAHRYLRSTGTVSRRAVQSWPGWWSGICSRLVECDRCLVGSASLVCSARWVVRVAGERG